MSRSLLPSKTALVQCFVFKSLLNICKTLDPPPVPRSQQACPKNGSELAEKLSLLQGISRRQILCFLNVYGSVFNGAFGGAVNLLVDDGLSRVQSLVWLVPALAKYAWQRWPSEQGDTD
eukprot:1507698-Amphidinium_carterae.2